MTDAVRSLARTAMTCTEALAATSVTGAPEGKVYVCAALPFGASQAPQALM